MQDLKRAIRDANNELLNAGEVGTQSYAEAQQKVAELKDRLGDLGDAAKIQGTAVEKLGASTGLLGEGFKNLDLDKIKIGFKGIGDAIKANPLMFLIGIIIPLLEKFKVFEILIGGVSKAFDLLTDAIGFTNHADEEASKSFIENKEKEKQALSDRYDAEITLAKAAGKDVFKLEQEKRDALIKYTEDELINLRNLYEKKKQFNDDELKKYDELQKNLLKLQTERTAAEIKNEADKQKIQAEQYNNLLSLEDKLRVAGLSAREKEIDTIKKQQQSLTQELDKNHNVRIGNEMADTIRYNEDKKKIEELTQQEINKVNNKYYQENLEKRKAANEALNQANESLNQKIKQLRDKEYIDGIQNERLKAIVTLKIQTEAQIEEIKNIKGNAKLKKEAIEEIQAGFRQAEAKINEDFDKKDEEIRKQNEAKEKELEQQRLDAIKKANQDAYDEEERFNELRILQTQEGTKERLDAEIEAINTRAQHEINTGKKTAAEIALIKKKSGQQIAKLQEEFDDKEIKEEYKKAYKYISRTDQTFKTLGDLSTIFYNTKLNHAKKGSAEEEKILKQQFEVNKAFQIANAIINGATAVTGILASTSSKDPLGIIGVIRIAAAIATTAAQISTIERTRFESAAPQTPETPSMSAAAEQAPTGTPQMPQTRTEQGTFLNEQGQTTGRLDTRVYVLESDITNTQRDVNRVKTQSKV